MSDDTQPPTITRRAALRKGTLVGGAMLWAVPTVQALSTNIASAEVASELPGSQTVSPPGSQTVSPPGSPPVSPPASPPATTDVLGVKEGQPQGMGRRRKVTPSGSGKVTPSGSGSEAITSGSPGTLPRTGPSISVWDTATVGGALLVGGAALRKLSGKTPESSAVLPESAADTDE